MLPKPERGSNVLDLGSAYVLNKYWDHVGIYLEQQHVGCCTVGGPFVGASSQVLVFVK